MQPVSALKALNRSLASFRDQIACRFWGHVYPAVRFEIHGDYGWGDGTNEDHEVVIPQPGIMCPRCQTIPYQPQGVDSTMSDVYFVEVLDENREYVNDTSIDISRYSDQELGAMLRRVILQAT
jgi:hypothetical protein